MSVFQPLGAAAFTVGLARQNDERLLQRGTTTGAIGVEASPEPWRAGLLRGRSFFFGPEEAMMLTEDCEDVVLDWDSRPAAGGGAQRRKIIGTTLDSGGSPLGNCIVQGFVTATDTFVFQVTSDTAGYFELPTQYVAAQHYLVAYKAGSPDIAGTTLNTLTPT